MNPNINIEQIKQYNTTLRQYKEKSAKLRAEIEFNQKEIQRQCDELGKELGITVTVENLPSLLSEYISKINTTMQIGTEILNKIKSEEIVAQQAEEFDANRISAPAGANAPRIPEVQASQNVAGISDGVLVPPQSPPSIDSILDSFPGGLPKIF